MSITINGVSCEEIADGFEEAIDQAGPHAIKAYLCDWSSRYSVANGLVGFSSVSGSGDVPTATIVPPHLYPESKNMYCHTVSIRGGGKPTQGTKQIQWEKAIVTANYGVAQWGAIDDPSGANQFSPDEKFVYATQELDFGGEYITIPNQAYEYFDGTTRTKTGQDFGIFVPIIELNLTFHRLPYLPMGSARTAVQSPLNDRTFLGAAAGTVRFNGCRTKRTASSDGTIVQEVTFSFSHRPTADWNYGIHPTTGAWTKIVKPGTSTTFQAYSNLNALLFPDAYKY